MDRTEAEAILSRYERELAEGLEIDLWGHGFWRVVGWVKREPGEVDDFADRIAPIDQAGFDQGARASMPIITGEFLLWGLTVVGLGFVTVTYYVDQPWNWLVLGAGTAILLVATHPLAHLVVGRAVGIRFTRFFLGFEAQKIPEPGVKIDYASYLRTSPKRRAWMHASAAILSKLIPFLMTPVVYAADLPGWVVWVLVGVGVVAIIIDVVWSTKLSDWKRFRREMSIARELSARQP